MLPLQGARVWLLVRELRSPKIAHAAQHICIYIHFIQVLSCSVAQLCLTLCDSVHGSMPGFPGFHYLLEFAQLISTVSVMPSNHLILNHPLHLLPLIFPSIRVFSKELVLCITGPKYWSSSFSISPSNEYLGLFSLRMGWLDLPSVQGTLKSLLQHHSSKASILWHSAL